MTPADILLLGGADMRRLELSVDSVIGQTEGGFVLLASAQDIGAAGVALLASYADSRIVVLEELAACIRSLRGDYVAPLQAGDLLAPTFLAQLSAALEKNAGAVMAQCRVTRFDGTALRPADAADCAFLFRRDVLLKLAAHLPDMCALRRAAGACGAPVQVPQSLAITRMPGATATPATRAPAHLFGRTYKPADIDAERPPTLHVVVDTEAEFDWARPFATDLTSVSAMSGIGSAQTIFDRYGLRPVYVVDYPVASQPEGVAAIRAVADRGAAAVGAHLHPWANPPFGEDTSRRLSFPGNLPRALEAAKLDALLEVIGQNFATTPPFYKAGRYGFGPNTAALIASRGAHVDLSLLPQTDLRPQDGPDFSDIEPIPYHVDGTGLLSLPMTRAHVGVLAGHRGLHAWLDGPLASGLHLPALLARTRTLERLTLTPEGVPAGPQIRLLRALLARGHRMFVLHYHSPSLVAGHTPYVRTEADRVELLARIDAVCRWFFEELGGLPGRPWDLLPLGERARV